MKIMVTGASGFVGSFLTKMLISDDHEVIPASRDVLDLCDSSAVQSFFKENKIDIVLHAAVRGGRRTRVDTAEDFYQNLRMFENLYMNQDNFSLMINFASGAEFCRTRNIIESREEDLYKFFPSDYYGASKNLIAKKILQSNNMINLRIFNCFSENELEDRMIRANCERHIKGKSMIIHQNKMMDFFYIGDLYRVVQFYIKNYFNIFLPKDLNLVYNEKRDLFSIAQIINSLTTDRIDIIINNNSYSSSYTGDGTDLEALGIQLMGLESGIEYTYNILKRRRK